jgi:hypothetical protein
MHGEHLGGSAAICEDISACESVAKGEVFDEKTELEYLVRLSLSFLLKLPPCLCLYLDSRFLYLPVQFFLPIFPPFCTVLPIN